MTLADIFYLLGIVLMICFIICLISLMLGGVFMYKKLKQLEVRAQAKVDLLQQHLMDKKGMTFRALPLMPIISVMMPFVFRFIKDRRK